MLELPNWQVQEFIWPKRVQGMRCWDLFHGARAGHVHCMPGVFGQRNQPRQLPVQCGIHWTGCRTVPCLRDWQIQELAGIGRLYILPARKLLLRRSEKCIMSGMHGGYLQQSASGDRMHVVSCLYWEFRRPILLRLQRGIHWTGWWAVPRLCCRDLQELAWLRFLRSLPLRFVFFLNWCQDGLNLQPVRRGEVF
jgi:hypothetical protein